MPMYKINLFFRGRAAGWSETYYKEASTGLQLYETLIGTFLTKRLAILAHNYECNAARISDDAVQRDAYLWSPLTYAQFGTSFPGDTPWQALHIRLASGMRFWRALMIRGVPDCAFDTTAPGPVDGQTDWFGKLNSFIAHLKASQFRLKVVQKSPEQVRRPILGILAINSTTIRVSTVGDHGFAVGDTVQFYNIRNLSRPLGKRVVTAVETPLTFQVKANLGENFSNGPGGQVKKVVFEYPTIDDSVNRGFTHRIVGRPFGQQRGRRRAAPLSTA